MGLRIILVILLQVTVPEFVCPELDTLDTDLFGQEAQGEDWFDKRCALALAILFVSGSIFLITGTPYMHPYGLI